MENIDKGHEDLVSHLELLLIEAKEFEFHDFKNNEYPAPKIELVSRLELLKKNAIDGVYDN